MDKNKLLTAVGRRIRNLREERELSQRDLGLDSEKDRQGVAKLEGKVNFEMSTLYKVGMGLNVSMSYVLDINNEIKARSIRLKKMETDEVLKRLKERIMSLRMEKKLTQEAVVSAFGHGRQWFEKIVNGKGDFTVFTLYKIATGLGVSMAFLADINNEMET